MDIRDLIYCARILLYDQRKFRLESTTKAAVEEFFRVALSVGFPSMEGLEGVAFREELSSRIKRAINISTGLTVVQQGYGLAWRAIDVTYRYMTGDDSASQLQREAAVRLVDTLRKLNEPQLHAEAVEAYIRRLVNIQPFDLVSRKGEVVTYALVTYYQLMPGMGFASRPLDERALISRTLTLLMELTPRVAPWLDEQFKL